MKLETYPTKSGHAYIRTSLRWAIGIGALAAWSGVVYAQTPNMDSGLSEIVRAFKAASGNITASAAAPGFPISYDAITQTDASGRVLVEIYLNGSASMDDVRSNLLSLGANITGENPTYRLGAMSAYLPVSSLEALGNAVGVSALTLSYTPVMNVGKVTSQGTVVMRSDIANTNGFTGSGITVGVISDSFDRSTNAFTTVRAANDIASGDLPTPKFVLDDLATPQANLTDEGRAMSQIVFDVAPSSSLCFATANGGQAAFASNIRTLRTNPACAADVIVDDVFYFAEPYFSDGQVAQAANDVVNSNILAGRRVSYFSSAGNQQGFGFLANPANFVVTATVPGINLATIAACPSSPAGGTGADVTGGFLDFGGGTFFATITLGAGSHTLIMQWDDPFDLMPSGMTTDLNLIFFNTSGNCVIKIATNNFTLNEPIEGVGFNGAGTLRMMVSRTGIGTHLSSRVKLLHFGGITSTIFTQATPVTFGHSAAAGANSVAAYRYTNPVTQQSPFKPAFEPFSSPGPVIIAFDAAGNRLASGENRKKPDIAAPDGVNTTFFFPGQDFEGDGFFNFFGTSAAAPHAAGVAALLLQKGGGPGSLTPPQVKSYLQTSTPARAIPNSGNPALVKGWSMYDGFGLIDAVNALAKLP
jgi:Subtilase family